MSIEDLTEGVVMKTCQKPIHHDAYADLNLVCLVLLNIILRHQNQGPKKDCMFY